VLARVQDEFAPRAATMSGFSGLYIVRVDDLHLATAIFWASPAERDRAAEEVGQPFWDLVGPYIADASRADGEVLVAFTRP
jgi:hypothetical protein